MGQAISQFEVIDYSTNRQFSEEHNINEWQEIPPKNSNYYDGTRFFKVPRHLYPQYTKGYMYGYYESIDYYKKYIANITND